MDRRSETTQQTKHQQIETKALTYTVRFSNPHPLLLRREVGLQDSPDFGRVSPACKHARHYNTIRTDNP